MHSSKFGLVHLSLDQYNSHFLPSLPSRCIDYTIIFDAITPSGGSKNFERGDGRQFISPVLIYRKCTQRSIGLLHGKRRLLEKKLSQ